VKRLTGLRLLLISCYLGSLTGSLTGWAFTSVPSALEDFAVEIHLNRDYGIIPFEVIASVRVTSGSDSIEAVVWDFESDGSFDATGEYVVHTFAEASDYRVTADILTRDHGNLVRTDSVSGHTALMTLTFDDGHISDYTLALPLLESRGVKATAYIVPTWLGGTWYMDWTQVQTLHDAGWDICSHGLTHAKLTQVDDGDLHYELSQSQLELQTRGYPARHFAVPNGAYDDRVLDAVKLYYDSNRIIGGLNPSIHEVDPYLLHCDETLSYRSFQYYRTNIDSVVAHRGWYILNNHKVATNCYDATWCVSDQMLLDIVDYALGQRLKIVTIEEALSAKGGDTAGITDSPSTSGPILTVQSHQYRLTNLMPEIAITYSVTEATVIDLAIYDVLGRLVCPVVTGSKPAGTFAETWRGTDQAGRPVASGVYFGCLRAGDGTSQSLRIAVLR
jgi:peptidoglycan/xylan/chitin deacetylase (PgdA/CDA1 family)